MSAVDDDQSYTVTWQAITQSFFTEYLLQESVLLWSIFSHSQTEEIF